MDTAVSWDFTGLRGLAVYLADQIAAHRRPGITAADGFEAGLHKVMEEAGELAGAHSRLRGTSRRAGTVADVENELADVYLSAAVYAVQAGVTAAVLPESGYPVFPPPDRQSGNEALTRLGADTGKLCQVHGQLPAGNAAVAAAVTRILRDAHEYAHSTGIDLHEAVARKVSDILARGWHEEDPAASQTGTR
jgi:hypothetical protein